MTIKETAQKWGCTASLVSILLRLERIQGAIKGSRTVWYIPDDAKKPEPLKKGRPREHLHGENI